MSAKTVHFLFQILFFCCFGLAAEVVFTALTALFTHDPLCNNPLWSLTGITYVWMIFIYALIPILLSVLYPRLKSLHIILRLLIYVALIYAVEFTSGFLLEKITGKCPWEYTTGWHVMGYIRLDYFPSWLFFSWLVERLYVYLSVKLAPDQVI